jgi:glyoxylase I family protein
MTKTNAGLALGNLRSIHHAALNVQNLNTSKDFYKRILGLQELTGEAAPETLRDAIATGQVANFLLPDGSFLDLFFEPHLTPPHPDPNQQFTRANHLAFDIPPDLFDTAVEILKANGVSIAEGPVTRPTGKGIYFHDPDGFLLEIRCDPAENP